MRCKHPQYLPAGRLGEVVDAPTSSFAAPVLEVAKAQEDQPAAGFNRESHGKPQKNLRKNHRKSGKT